MRCSEGKCNWLVAVPLAHQQDKRGRRAGAERTPVDATASRCQPVEWPARWLVTNDRVAVEFDMKVHALLWDRKFRLNPQHNTAQPGEEAKDCGGGYSQKGPNPHGVPNAPLLAGGVIIRHVRMLPSPKRNELARLGRAKLCGIHHAYEKKAPGQSKCTPVQDINLTAYPQGAQPKPTLGLLVSRNEDDER